MSQTQNSTTQNYMVWSIVNTVLGLLSCCFIYCLPALGTGIAAIVFSSKVNSLLAAGDIAGAEKASKTAKLLNWITTGLVAVSFIAWIIYFVIFGMTAMIDVLDSL